EVDVQEKLDLRLRKVSFYRKETTVKGLRAAAGDGCDEVGPVVRSKRADFDPASIAQRLECRIVGRFHHDRQRHQALIDQIQTQTPRAMGGGAAAGSAEAGDVK